MTSVPSITKVNDDSDSIVDNNNETLSEYEKARMERIKRNEQRLDDLGLLHWKPKKKNIPWRKRHYVKTRRSSRLSISSKNEELVTEPSMTESSEENLSLKRFPRAFYHHNKRWNQDGLYIFRSIIILARTQTYNNSFAPDKFYEFARRVYLSSFNFGGLLSMFKKPEFYEFQQFIYSARKKIENLLSRNHSTDGTFGDENYPENLRPIIHDWLVLKGEEIESQLQVNRSINDLIVDDRYPTLDIGDNPAQRLNVNINNKLSEGDRDSLPSLATSGQDLESNAINQEEQSSLKSNIPEPPTTITLPSTKNNHNNDATSTTITKEPSSLSLQVYVEQLRELSLNMKREADEATQRVNVFLSQIITLESKLKYLETLLISQQHQKASRNSLSKGDDDTTTSIASAISHDITTTTNKMDIEDSSTLHTNLSLDANLKCIPTKKQKQKCNIPQKSQSQPASHRNKNLRPKGLTPGSSNSQSITSTISNSSSGNDNAVGTKIIKIYSLGI